jgi:hypothetical protein
MHSIIWTPILSVRKWACWVFCEDYINYHAWKHSEKKGHPQPWGPLSGVKFRDGDFVSGLWIQILLPETYSKLHLNDCAQQQSPVELWGLPEITVSGYEIARSGMHPALFCLKCLVFFAEKPSLRRRKKVLTSLQNKSIREWGA